MHTVSMAEHARTMGISEHDCEKYLDFCSDLEDILTIEDITKRIEALQRMEEQLKGGFRYNRLKTVQRALEIEEEKEFDLLLEQTHSISPKRFYALKEYIERSGPLRKRAQDEIDKFITLHLTQKGTREMETSELIREMKKMNQGGYLLLMLCKLYYKEQGLLKKQHAYISSET